MKQLFLDLETTGLAPSFAGILEIAAVVTEETMDGPKVIDIFHEYIRPFHPIPAAVTAINGITNDMVANCRTEKEVLLGFGAWLIGNGYDKLNPVAHNGKFDFRFLKERSGIVYSNTADLFIEMETRLVDTLPMARKLIKAGKIKTKENKAKLEMLAEAFNIKFKAHNALEDTMALAKVYYKLKEL